MRYLIAFLLSVLVLTFAVCQTPVDSLFFRIDSLTIVTVEEEELPREGFYQFFCDESETYISTSSKEIIEGIRSTLNFSASNEVLWCSWDHILYGYEDGELIMELPYNSECNYIIYSTFRQFKTDSLWKYDNFKSFMKIRKQECTFNSKSLTDAYIETIRKDNRIILLRTEKSDSLNAKFIYQLKYR